MSFQEVIGHDSAIDILKRAIQTQRLAAAYLFIGDEGIGKHLVAVNLAKALNCEANGLEPCDNCPSCLKISKGGHPDVHLINGDETGTIKIEMVRQLKLDINLKPYEAKIKVFIINDAHNLTPEAANALLKVLEEPPRMSLFILISSQVNLLAATIVSRCQSLRFFPLKKERLKELLSKEYNLDINLSHFLAYSCEGRIGEALKNKDNDILTKKNRVIDEFLRERDKTIEFKDRSEVKVYLEILLRWFRDIYLMKIGCAHSQLINIDRKNDLLLDMAKFSYPDLDEIIRSISDTALYLEQNINPRLLLSNLKLRLWTGSHN